MGGKIRATDGEVHLPERPEGFTSKLDQPMLHPSNTAMHSPRSLEMELYDRIKYECLL